MKGRYFQMDLAQRTAWVQEFTQFYDEELPLLERQNDTPNERMFDHGLALLDYFDIAQTFVANCRQFGQYRQRLTRLRFMADTVRSMAMDSAMVAQLMAERTQDAVRKGRPAVAEAAALATERSLNALANDHCEAVAALGGKKKRGRGRPPKGSTTETEKAPKQPPQRHTPRTVSQSSQMMLMMEPSNFDHDGRPRLRDLTWLLPQELAKGVGEVREWRREAETEGAMARQLARMKGVGPTAVSQHSSACVEAEKRIHALYHAIDLHLGWLLLKLRLGDEETAAWAEERLTEHGMSREALMKMLEPYYDKVKDELKSNAGRPSKKKQDPAANVETSEEEEERKRKAAMLHKARTYILRKDIRPSRSRIEKCMLLIQQLQAAGEDTKAFEMAVEAMKSERLEQ